MTSRDEILQTPPLPCPFCGSTNIQVEDDTYTAPFCECRDCLACGPHGGTAEGAVERWNRRAVLEQKNEARS